MVKKIIKLWYNRPQAKLMRECLELSGKLLEDVETLEKVLKGKGYIK